MSLILCDYYADPILKQLTVGSIVVLYHVDRATREAIEARLGDITVYAIRLLPTSSIEDIGIVCLTIGLSSRLDMFIRIWRSSGEMRAFDSVGRYMIRSNNCSLLIPLTECVLWCATGVRVTKSMNDGERIRYITSRSCNVSKFMPFLGTIVNEAITTGTIHILELVFDLIHERHHRAIYDEGLEVAMTLRNIPSILLFLNKGARGRMGPMTLNVVTEMNDNDLFDRYIKSTPRPTRLTDYGRWCYLEETLKIAIDKKNDYIANSLLTMVKNRAPDNVFRKFELFYNKHQQSK